MIGGLTMGQLVLPSCKILILWISVLKFGFPCFRDPKLSPDDLLFVMPSVFGVFSRLKSCKKQYTLLFNAYREDHAHATNQ